MIYTLLFLYFVIGVISVYKSANHVAEWREIVWGNDIPPEYTGVELFTGLFWPIMIPLIYFLYDKEEAFEEARYMSVNSIEVK